MKRKFICAALFGTLVLAPASTFVSCSDYDGDISSLNEQTASLKESLEKQATALTEAENRLKDEISASKQAAADALAAAQEAAAAGETAQATAEAAKADAALAKEAAATAKSEAVAEAKAYVDDIVSRINTGVTEEQLNSEISKLASQISGIENDLNQLDSKYVSISTYEEAIQELNIQLDAVKKYQDLINANKTAIEKLQSTVETQGTSLTNLSGKITAIEGTISDIQNAIKDIDKLATSASVKDLETAVNKKLSDITTSVTTLQTNLVTLLSRQLKSLVFEPDFYYQGIEALSASTFIYTPLTTNKVDVNGNHSTDAPKAGTKDTYMTPDLTATYHLNPSNADIDVKDMSRYSFVVYNKDYVKATGNTITPSIYSSSVENGKLTVKARFANAELIQDIANNDAVTVLALQYTAGNDSEETGEAKAKITSDYAAVKAFHYKDLILNNAKAVQTPGVAHTTHLFTTAQAAINSDDNMVDILFDGTLDLNTVVNTHYSIEGGKTDIAWDANAADGKAVKSGFKYVYELVGYYAGTNRTSETAHLSLNADGHTVRPQVVDDEGRQLPWGAAQGERTVGKKPLVRVTLVDTTQANPQIAAVGYLKLHIVKQLPEDKIETVEATPYTNAYTVVCGSNTNVLSEDMHWAEVENKILGLLDIPKAEFEAGWALETFNDGQTAIQYESNKAGAKQVATPFGVIKEVVDAGTHETTVLRWTVTNKQAYEYFSGKGHTSKTVYVRYKENGKNNYVCVAFTWTPSAINIAPVASIADEDKNQTYWFAENSSAQGYADIHGNVEVVGQAGADDEFKFLVTNTFVGNTVKLGGLDKYTQLANAASIYYVFVEPTVKSVTGFSGVKYTLGVSADGSKFTATCNGVTETIATIGATSGEIELLKSSDYAKDLLNNADHNDLGAGQTLTGKVAIKATTCEPVSNLEMANNEFNVKFLRPVTVKNGTAEFTDATTGGSTSKVGLSFVDWREIDFNSTEATAVNFYAYYKVTSIKADIDHITTNMNGANIDNTLLTSISKNVKFSYAEPATNPTSLQWYLNRGDFGTVTYQNNGTPISADFQVKIPVTITYDWGTLKAYIIATVHKTQGQNAHHR